MRELVLTGLDHGVHGVRHGEGVHPVMVGYIAVVLPHCQREAHQVRGVKPATNADVRHAG